MIVPLTIEHAIHIAYRMRDSDKQEVMASSRSEYLMDFARECMFFGGYCLLAKDGEPVAMGGIAKQWDGVGNGWLVGTERLTSHMVEISKLIRRELSKPEWRRVQAWSHSGHKTAHVWLNRLGFVNAHTLRYFGKQGEDFYLFELIKD